MDVKPRLHQTNSTAGKSGSCGAPGWIVKSASRLITGTRRKKRQNFGIDELESDKKNMWLYVIGPMLGRENLNREAFVKARNELWDAGYHVLIPHDVMSPDTSHEQTMQNRIMSMLRCDGVAALIDWDESSNSRLEFEVASICGFEIHCVDTWLCMVEEEA